MARRLYSKPKPMAQQAQLVLKPFLKLSSRHQEKQSQHLQGSRTTGYIHSLRTLAKYTSSLKQAGDWAKDHAGINYLKDLTPEIAQAYLDDRTHQVGQKQLDADRNALEFITGRHTLERVKPHTEHPRYGHHSRAYTPEQISRILSQQPARDALATAIAYEAGLRAHELLTLRRLNEATASTHRDWHPQRFLGRTGQRYLVTGKGGLRREVIIPPALAQRLENRRYEQPKRLKDRGINHQQHYNLAGGQTWAERFSTTARDVLGWSTGAHGLRHSYAQERLRELQSAGMNYYSAREILSQELGHFRGDVVETYLR